MIDDSRPGRVRRRGHDADTPLRPSRPLLPASRPVLLVLCLAVAGDAGAQRAAENVVRSVSDAFGASVGNEQIGLYSTTDVRGFSPTTAGNVRLEGLFIDRQADFSNRLVSGSTIRAGLAAQGYLLPAPTGIADFSLRRVADTPTHSVILERSAYGGVTAAADLQARWREDLETTLGFGYQKREVGDGTTDITASVGGTLRFAPGPRTEVTAFGDYVEEIQNEISQRYFPGGPYPPPRVTRLKFVGQPWTEFSGPRYNAGVIAAYTPGAWEYRVGIFRSSRERDIQTGQFFLDVAPDGSANSRAVLGPPSSLASDSLEARATRHLRDGLRHHSVTASVRVRQRVRDFGGTVGIDLGQANIDEPEVFERPDVDVGELSREWVDQVTVGFAYDLEWESVGQLDIGLQRSSYVRQVAVPDTDEKLTTNTDPFLFNVTANAPLRPGIVAYGGVVQGFEESPVAPPIAINRNEAPPATETRQFDAGLRMDLGRMTAVAGVFQIDKPFFGLDQDRFFGEQGMQTNRGIELSLAGPVTDALQLVVGTVLYDVALSGEAVDSGELADSPVGALTRSTTLNLDYRPAWAPGWSFDLGLSSRGEQNGDTQGLVTVEPRTLLDLGLRRQFSLADKTVVIRGRVTNVLDEWGWEVRPTGDYRYVNPRAFSISLRMDI
jgi:iron complex outermembrane receptor protein